MPIDAYASYSNYFDHILPIWERLDGRIFYTSPSTKRPGTITRGLRKSDELLIVAGYPDLKRTRRPTIFVEHGAGETYGLSDPHYSGGTGRERVELFLCPNRKVYEANESKYPGRSVIVGSPRLEWLRQHNATKRGGVSRDGRLRVAVSFHWQCRIHPQAGTALHDYQPFFKHWATDTRIELVGHAHPRIAQHAEKFYAAAGIPFASSFDDVVSWADVYAVDNSSTLFEAAALGIDVVVLDSPHYTPEETGFRFWKYADIGPRISPGQDFVEAALSANSSSHDYDDIRDRMVAEIFGTITGSIDKAVSAIRTVQNGYQGPSSAADSGTDPTQPALFSKP